MQKKNIYESVETHDQKQEGTKLVIDASQIEVMYLHVQHLRKHISTCGA